MPKARAYTPENVEAQIAAGYAPLTDPSDDLYRTSVQISELNALNASLAMIRYKQWRGFYFLEGPREHLVFEVRDLKVVDDGAPDAD